ncbi:hypothetical protein [Ethanoligenens sp.]|uniref:hypothetical protein n=1 Tax=Ethanoligenens sp. TaxID=2099655 RepID=UPI0039EB7F5B
MSKTAKEKAVAPVNMDAAGYRRKIIGMVSEINDTKSLQTLYDITNSYSLRKGEPLKDLSKAELMEKRIYWYLSRIRDPKYLKFICGYVYRLFLKLATE